jgi:transcriptional regulator with XRE-family HTH domain
MPVSKKSTIASDRLTKYASRRGMTQEKLAVILGVTQETISRWMSGSSTPRLEMAVRIQDLTKRVHPKDWFKDVVKKEPKGA